MATFKKIKFGDGLAVTDEGAGVITVAGSGGPPGPAGPTGPTGPPGPAGTPTDATTSAKGIVQLAGDLAGTAASPQIAAGVIVDADIAAANKDGTAATPSLRTLGTGAQQAAAGNDARFGAGAELAYAERTSNMTVSTTPSSAATAPPVTLPATTIVWVEFSAVAVMPPAAQDLYLHLYVDGAAVAVLAAFNGPTYVPTLVRRRLSAAAGSRTFGVFASVTGGSGTISANTGTGGTNAPAYIRVTQG